MWRTAVSWLLFSWLSWSLFPNRYFISSSLSASSEPKPSFKPMTAKWWSNSLCCRVEKTEPKGYLKLHICATSHCGKARGFITCRTKVNKQVYLYKFLFLEQVWCYYRFCGGRSKDVENPNISQVCSSNLSISLQTSLMRSILFEKQIRDLLKGIPSRIFPWGFHISNVKK